jgi:hypothetical protein
MAVQIIDKDLVLSGGWNAAFTTQSGKSIIDAEGVYRGLFVHAIDNNVVVENFVVQNSFTAFFEAPGAIYLFGSLTLRNSDVQNNQTTGIYYDAPSTTSLVISNSTIAGNTSPDVEDVPGGLLITNTGVVTIDNSAIGSNSGSGIGNVGGVVTITNSRISNNSGAVWGAGIRNGGSLTIHSSLVAANTTATGFNLFGGGIYNHGVLSILNSTISNNISNGHGGGIYQSSGTLALYNSTISANWAPSGSGVYVLSGTTTLANTILADNRLGSDGPDCSGEVTSLGHNLLGSTSGCSFVAGPGDLIDIPPLLGPLQHNGGPSFTHALLPGSPAIDAGNPAGCRDQNGNLVSADQRGVARPQGGRCDIGSFELEAANPVIQVTIDILPASAINIINMRSTGTVPVAILSTAAFDARAMVDRTSLTFGATGDELSLASCNSKGSDVNHDGLLDLVCHFHIQLTGFQNHHHVGVLLGSTMAGTPFEASDAVRIVKK